MERSFDLAVVGAGIVGLAHALAAARRGLRVVVFDREAEAIGASVRNFGFVTVTGQAAGTTWRRARRTRDVWAEVAPRAGIRIEQRGLVVAARRLEAMAVLEAFRATPMGTGCALLTAAGARARVAALRAEALAGALWSPHELRVESRSAIPLLTRWLETAHGVVVHRATHVHAAGAGRLETTAGAFRAARIVVAPGDERLALFAERFAALGIERVRLHMMKVMPADPAPLVSAAVMSDLSLVRYLGYAALPEAEALARRLAREEAAKLAHGIHLIAVQGADGGLIVGDSHHHEAAPSPFAAAAVDELILAELDAVFALPDRRVVERWTGTYAHLSDRRCVIDAPEAATRLVVVTSGTGASTAFAIGEEVVAELCGDAARHEPDGRG